MTFNIFALRSLSKAIKAGEKARQSLETQHPRAVGDEGDALAAWHASQQEFKDQVASSAAIVEALKIVDLSVAVAATEVAETIQQAAALIPDRLNLLVRFLNRTDPPSADADAPRNFFARLLINVGVPELGVLALEEGAKTGLEEIGKEVAAQFVPVVGSVFKIAIGIHEKRELLQERREHMEQLAKSRLGPGPTDDMLTLTANFQQDDQTIREFVELIDKLAADLTNRVLPELA